MKAPGRRLLDHAWLVVALAIAAAIVAYGYFAAGAYAGDDELSLRLKEAKMLSQRVTANATTEWIAFEGSSQDAS